MSSRDMLRALSFYVSFSFVSFVNVVAASVQLIDPVTDERQADFNETSR